MAVASVAAKELLTWLISVIKKRKAKTSITANFDKWLAPYTSIIITDVIFIAITSLNLTTTIRDPAPVTRAAVAYIAFWVALFFYWVLALIQDKVKLRNYRAAQRAAANETLAEQRPGRDGEERPNV